MRHLRQAGGVGVKKQEASVNLEVFTCPEGPVETCPDSQAHSAVLLIVWDVGEKKKGKS